jgi:hypothetical protein
VAIPADRNAVEIIIIIIVVIIIGVVVSVVQNFILVISL